MDLTLDPDDGRETCLRLKRNTIKPFADNPFMAGPPPSPYVAELDGALRRMLAAVRERLDEDASLADAFGYAIADVTYSTESDLSGDPYRVTLTATYRLVRAWWV